MKKITETESTTGRKEKETIEKTEKEYKFYQEAGVLLAVIWAVTIIIVIRMLVDGWIKTSCVC